MAGKQNVTDEKEKKAASGAEFLEKQAAETKPGTGPKQEEKPTGKKNGQDASVYTIEEFAANAVKLFGVRREIVVAAFQAEGMEKCTKEQAKQIIDKFRKREVR
ncbi:MAG: hypothetical protein K2P76_11650 [Lachnospiraceae bacterium]|nr:hypothetical protein [Lachnospiraceae bacterium]MDE6982175.1 hypothetical protein [Lachnospiraceae bacterium]